MKKVDYILVGLGIAGLTFCEQLLKNNKTFVVYDTQINSSTRVSAGIINPMVLKRFTPVWKAKEHTQSSLKFYETLSKKLKCNFFTKLPMLRVFTSMEEQNNWMVASDKKELSSFLNSKIIKNTNPYINAPFGLGQVNFSARIDTSNLLNNYSNFLLENQQLISETFDYSLLKETNTGLKYKNISAKKIVFCEGASSRLNPFFKKEYLLPLKGEFITIHAPKLQLNGMLKTSLFLIPLVNDLYKVGATYDREDDTFSNTEQARNELVKNISNTINCKFTVTSQEAGIRPTTRDRRPLLGNLENKNLFFYTGLGTRGMMTSPSLAIQLYDCIENNKPLDKEIDIMRMNNKCG